MRINSEVQAPPQPVRERRQPPEPKERELIPVEKPQERSQPEGPVGRNVDMTA
jgi:hypothetical protein